MPRRRRSTPGRSRKDKDFYAFYRRMEAYKQAFSGGGSTMILNPTVSSAISTTRRRGCDQEVTLDRNGTQEGLWRSCNALPAISRRSENLQQSATFGPLWRATIGGHSRRNLTRGAAVPTILGLSAVGGRT